MCKSPEHGVFTEVPEEDLLAGFPPTNCWCCTNCVAAHDTVLQSAQCAVLPHQEICSKHLTLLSWSSSLRYPAWRLPLPGNRVSGRQTPQGFLQRTHNLEALRRPWELTLHIAMCWERCSFLLQSLTCYRPRACLKPDGKNQEEAHVDPDVCGQENWLVCASSVGWRTENTKGHCVEVKSPWIPIATLLYCAICAGPECFFNEKKMSVNP